MKKKSLSILIALALTTSTALVAAPKVFADTTNVAPVTATTPVTAAPQVASNVGVTAQGQVQNIGWQSWVNDGTDIGTVGQSLRLETLRMKLTGDNLPTGAGIQYQVQVQNIGWMNPVNDGANAGTVGQSLRLETARIKLVNMPGYTVQYRAQVQNIGWMPWVSDGADAGTVGQSLRMETLQVRVVKTDAEKVAEATAETAVEKAEASKVQADVDAAKAAIANVQDTTQVAAFNYRMNAITTKLTVTSVTADNAATVKVAFNKPLNVATATNTSNYTINGGAPTSAKLSDDKTTVTLALNPSSPLANNHTAYPIVVSKNVVSAAGDAMAADYTTNYTFSDTTAPTLGAVSYPDNNTAKVSFSEPMAVLAASNVQVFDANGVNVTSTIVPGSIALGGTDLTVDMTSASLNQPYTVYVYGAQDLAGNYAGTQSFTITKTNADTTAPTVTSVKATGLDTFVVTYSEKVKATAGSYANYKIDGTAVSGTGITSETPSTDGTQVTVKVATPLTAGMHDVNVTGETDVSNNVQSASYDKMLDFETNTATPNVTSASVQTIGSADYLVVKYDDPTATINPTAPTAAVEKGTYVNNNIENDFTAFGASTDVTPYDSDGDGINDSIKIALPTAPALNAGTYTTNLAAGLVINAAGNASKETPITFTYSPAAAPVTALTATVTPATDITNKVVKVHFSNNVTAATALNVNNYTVDGQNVFSNAIFEGDTKTVKLTLKPNTINADAARLLAISNVTGVDGTVMTPYRNSLVFVDNTAPKLVSAQLTDASTIVLTFSENVKAAKASGKVDENDFDVYVGANKVAQSTATSSITDSVVGKTITLKLSTPLTASDLTNSITVTPSAANDAIDVDSNAFSTSPIIVSHN